MTRIGIIGAGSWGIALAILLEKNGHQVTVWSALADEIDSLQKTREHTAIPGVRIKEEIVLTTVLTDAVNEMDVVVIAVASPYVRTCAAKLRDIISKDTIIVNVAKGIEEGSLMTMSQVIADELPSVRIAVLSGPSHAEEVGRSIPTTIVVGADDDETAEFLQNIFMNEVFRVYRNRDVMGIELGAALKNVVALAAGICDGQGYGDNSKAALITRGITEIARLGVAMGGNTATFYGLSGIGDLIVTCASHHSRNRRAGILIGKGAKMEAAMAEVEMVVEGVYSAKSGLALAKKHGVSVPIIEQVNEVLFAGKEPSAAIRELMIRERKEEY
ncbi:MAG: NAD(P)-dependent glycerol-3-phosphate dehydrogenase [Lachnospiraceae bacterium]|jgi:glycerol-3-phosphate dehydrogenase (NAD(P)+)|nr:NAD(P)-dependent glycerol-3-phosphate dehydrogenase [Lachnospiraceae bacterium]